MVAEYISCNLLTSINLVCKGCIIALCLKRCNAKQLFCILIYNLFLEGEKKKIPVTGMTVLIQ